MYVRGPKGFPDDGSEFRDRGIIVIELSTSESFPQLHRTLDPCLRGWKTINDVHLYRRQRVSHGNSRYDEKKKKQGLVGQTYVFIVKQIDRIFQPVLSSQDPQHGFGLMYYSKST